ncbi:MAG TPA: hypothetical protein VMR06_11475 [Dokdonella sp.]|nr:hypothetical protein [Dokdonella sp.]HUD42598.1 hypothetical protein [Dokdonella sp.]
MKELAIPVVKEHVLSIDGEVKKMELPELGRLLLDRRLDAAE